MGELRGPLKSCRNSEKQLTSRLPHDPKELHSLAGSMMSCAARSLTAGYRKARPIPSTRELSLQYGISRRTAVSVFEQLHSEGYLVSRTGSGTRVNDTLPEDFLEIRPSRPIRERKSESDIPPLFRRPARPFRAIEPALNEFPIELWSQIASRRMRKLSTALLAGGEIAGHRPFAKQSLLTSDLRGA